jgi:hypothetical protein
VNRGPLCLLLLVMVCGCEKPSETPAPSETESTSGPTPEPAAAPTPVADEPTGRLADLLADLESPDTRTRRDACVDIASLLDGREHAADALVELATRDRETSVQRAAVRGLEVMGDEWGRKGLRAVVLDASDDAAGWKAAVYALRTESAKDAASLLETYRQRLQRSPESGVVLADAVRGLEPPASTIELLMVIVRGPDDQAARQAARVLFEYRRAAETHFLEVVRRVMPSLRGHAERRTFGFEVVRPELPSCIEALAAYMAESDDDEDWLAVLDVLVDGVPPHRQTALPHIRAVAVRDDTTREVRLRIRELLRGPYADQIVAKLGTGQVTYAPLLTSADHLEWEVFHLRSTETHGAMWVAERPTQIEVGAVPRRLDYLVLDEDGVVLQVLADVRDRGFRTIDGMWYMLVLEAGSASRLGVGEGDRVEFDQEMLQGLTEF